ncbi:hypothetical protein OHA70_13325 [Kribbella sp. NBC_00382]|uniref:hypothetical protein n=1 Tax=Kribbella sp. NBC_00382 TaxID=2975967 RepID=UPI002E20B066
MRDWDQFLEQTPWFLQPGDEAVVGAEQPWSRAAVEGLPQLTGLLSSATVTAVSISGTAYELLAWGPPGDRRGWLGYPPLDADVDVHPTHRSFWHVSGGLVERFGEPATWWMNQDEILTPTVAQTSVADVLADYSWLWEDDGLTLPIQPNEYYAVAVEANGNLTLAHRRTGELLLFAPDHAFTGATPLTGCPPYSLLTFDQLPDLAAWIEDCAAGWRYA